MLTVGKIMMMFQVVFDHKYSCVLDSGSPWYRRRLGCRSVRAFDGGHPRTRRRWTHGENYQISVLSRRLRVALRNAISTAKPFCHIVFSRRSIAFVTRPSASKWGKLTFSVPRDHACLQSWHHRFLSAHRPTNSSPLPPPVD